MSSMVAQLSVANWAMYWLMSFLLMQNCPVPSLPVRAVRPNAWAWIRALSGMNVRITCRYTGSWQIGVG